MLSVKNLSVSVEGTSILKELSLDVQAGETAAVMGPNGSGKSTLASVIAGHPSYEVTGGEIFWNGENILELEPEERASRGIFLSFQYPPTIAGVSVSQFLRLAKNSQEKAREEEVTSVAAFIKELRSHMKLLGIPMSFAERGVNEGFSGGEKKRLEMLQMLVLAPKLVILDEVDSGLDIDAIKVVADAVHALPVGTTILVITHYQRLLHYIIPDSVHVLKAGKVVQSGNKNLALELEKTGYVGI